MINKQIAKAQKKEGSPLLTDLHSHILPGIDDGAKDEEVSVQLLKMEYESGVRQIALTSHFNCENQDLNEFLLQREKSYERMCREMCQFHFDELRLKLGAEVFFSPNLCTIDIEKLCLEETDFLLLELPTEMYPAYFFETVYKIQARGITPIIAHIERYPYVMSNPNILCDWIDCGIYTQMNAQAMFWQNKTGRFCSDLFKWNLAHVLSSDTHSLKRRPPNLSEGIEALKQRLGQPITENVLYNADSIFNNIHPEINMIHSPKKIFARWR